VRFDTTMCGSRRTKVDIGKPEPADSRRTVTSYQLPSVQRARISTGSYRGRRATASATGVSPDTPAPAVPTVDSTIGELHLLPMMLNTAAHCVMTPLLLPATPASSDVSWERMLLLSGASGSGGYDSSSMLFPMISTWSVGRVTLVKA
jgi:hypothetical protein